MKKIKVFDVGNEVMTYVEEKKPSIFVPFKGSFPLLSPALHDEYYKYVASDKNLDECPIWIQDIINKGLRIQAIERGFKEYLRYNGIFQEFMKMDNSKKATELIRFLNANSMTLEYLDI